MLQKKGESGGYLSTHPSFSERLEKYTYYVSNSSLAKGAVARNAEEKAIDARHGEAAEGLVKRKHWKQLALLVIRWQRQAPNSAHSWYYGGLYEALGTGNLSAARRAFASALEIDPGHMPSRFQLCMALYAEGRKVESVYCSRSLVDDWQDAFVAQTFGEALWVGGEVEPFTTVLVVRDASGRKYVTNDHKAPERNGAKPIRYFAE
jgi:hypothetical protein